MTQRKRVKTDRYRQRMQREANKQKSLRAGRDVVAPKMKASTFVNDVIVIEGPELLTPILKRSCGCRSKEVWSIAFAMTNMSSTPIPMSRNAMRLCTPLCFNPMLNAMLNPAK